MAEKIYRQLGLLGDLTYEQYIEKHGVLDIEQFRQKQANDYNALDGDLTGYNCAICKNKGLIQQVKNGDLVNYQCECMKKRKVIRNLEKSGLADVIKDYTFSAYETHEDWQEKVKKTALDYLKQTDKWFFIGGQSGSGKTHICTAICGQLLKHGKSIKYMLWVADIRSLKANVNNDVYENLFDEFIKVDVLYIDDLFKIRKGAELSNADIQHTFNIIDTRVRMKKTTIISSEMTLDEIIDIDSAIGGRIKKATGDFYIRLTGAEKNWRLK